MVSLAVSEMVNPGEMASDEKGGWRLAGWEGANTVFLISLPPAMLATWCALVLNGLALMNLSSPVTPHLLHYYPPCPKHKLRSFPRKETPIATGLCMLFSVFRMLLTCSNDISRAAFLDFLQQCRTLFLCAFRAPRMFIQISFLG